MRTKLIESIAEMIQTLTEEEKTLLDQKVAENKAMKSEVKPKERHFQETATPEEWIKAFREWAESHRRDSPLLSDEAISRESIYGERG
ncbi:MAG TPA: hypothetical protein V6D28_17475 [Leptolyngbyaceae cyanobacterium]